MKHIKQDYSSKAWFYPPSQLDLGDGWVRGLNSTFSEYVHVEYQIKVNEACSNMVARVYL